MSHHQHLPYSPKLLLLLSSIKFFYGTAWKENHTAIHVYNAIQAGFRAIDTANQRKHYDEQLVGEGLQLAYENGLVRNRLELFLQSKFTHITGQDDHRLPYDKNATIPIQVQQSFQSSCKHLHTDFLDSLILHGPKISRGLHAHDWQAWQAMEQLVNHKQVRYIGISNVNLGQLQELVEYATIKPTFVQNRCYASTGWDQSIRQFCVQHDIIYQGFSLLTANTSLLQPNNHLIQEIIQASDPPHCTPEQIIFKFAYDVGMIPITGTTNTNHMKQDLFALDTLILKYKDKNKSPIKLIEIMASMVEGKI
jgi:diketogulonate reductase-like aldo/keto reductase